MVINWHTVVRLKNPNIEVLPYMMMMMVMVMTMSHFVFFLFVKKSDLGAHHAA